MHSGQGTQSIILFFLLCLPACPSLCFLPSLGIFLLILERKRENALQYVQVQGGPTLQV